VSLWDVVCVDSTVPAWKVRRGTRAAFLHVFVPTRGGRGIAESLARRESLSFDRRANKTRSPASNGPTECSFRRPRSSSSGWDAVETTVGCREMKPMPVADVGAGAPPAPAVFAYLPSSGESRCRRQGRLRACSRTENWGRPDASWDRSGIAWAPSFSRPRRDLVDEVVNRCRPARGRRPRRRRGNRPCR